jgi:hypothetical protein
VLPGGDVPQSQFDSAFTVIKGLKPIIARSKDARVKKAFGIVMDSVVAARKKSNGGSYAGFGAASHARSSAADAAALKESPAQKEARETDAMYAERLRPKAAK